MSRGHEDGLSMMISGIASDGAGRSWRAPRLRGPESLLTNGAPTGTCPMLRFTALLGTSEAG